MNIVIDKNFLGESVKGEFFLVVGERMSKFSGSAGFLLFSSSSKENTAIWSQFGPRLIDLTPCKDC